MTCELFQSVYKRQRDSYVIIQLISCLDSLEWRTGGELWAKQSIGLQVFYRQIPNRWEWRAWNQSDHSYGKRKI